MSIRGNDGIPKGLSVPTLLTYKYFVPEQQRHTLKSVTKSGVSLSEQESLVQMQDLITIELVWSIIHCWFERRCNERVPVLPQPFLHWIIGQIPSPYVNEAFWSYLWASLEMMLRELYAASASEPLKRIRRFHEFCGPPTKYVQLGNLNFDVEPVELLNCQEPGIHYQIPVPMPDPRSSPEGSTVLPLPAPPPPWTAMPAPNPLTTGTATASAHETSTTAARGSRVSTAAAIRSRVTTRASRTYASTTGSGRGAATQTAGRSAASVKTYHPVTRGMASRRGAAAGATRAGARKNIHMRSTGLFQPANLRRRGGRSQEDASAFMAAARERAGRNPRAATIQVPGLTPGPPPARSTSEPRHPISATTAARPTVQRPPVAVPTPTLMRIPATPAATPATRSPATTPIAMTPAAATPIPTHPTPASAAAGTMKASAAAGESSSSSATHVATETTTPIASTSGSRVVARSRDATTTKARTAEGVRATTTAVVTSAVQATATFSLPSGATTPAPEPTPAPAPMEI